MNGYFCAAPDYHCADCGKRVEESRRGGPESRCDNCKAPLCRACRDKQANEECAECAKETTHA